MAMWYWGKRFVGFLGLCVLLIAPRVAAGAVIPTLESNFSGGGGIIVGPSTATCDSTTKGGLRFNSSSNQFEYCDSAAWTPLAVNPACSDSTPGAFSFTDQTGVAVSTLTTSNIVQIAAISCNVTVSVSGSGSPQMQICSDAACSTLVVDWTSVSTTIASGQYLRVRLTSGSTGNLKRSLTVAVGGLSDQWDVTTVQNCTGSPAVGTVCPDGSVYAGISPDGNVKMYTTRCDAGMTWDGSACTGSNTQTSWNNGSNTWAVTGFTSATDGDGNTAGLAALTAAPGAYLSAKYCADLVVTSEVDGTTQITDWYLPSTSELQLLYSGRVSVGSFDTSTATTSYYWSSSETGNAWASALRFNTAIVSTPTKNTLYSVRCVRHD